MSLSTGISEIKQAEKTQKNILFFFKCMEGCKTLATCEVQPEQQQQQLGIKVIAIHGCLAHILATSTLCP